MQETTEVKPSKKNPVLVGEDNIVNGVGRHNSKVS